MGREGSSPERQVAEIGDMCLLPHHELAQATGLHEHFRELHRVLAGKEEIPENLLPHIALVHRHVKDLHHRLGGVGEEVQRACLFPADRRPDGSFTTYFAAATDRDANEMGRIHKRLVKMIDDGIDFTGAFAPPENSAFPYAAPGWREIEDFPRR